MDNLHLTILKDLVGFKSVTPNGCDAIIYCKEFLENLGFTCQKLQFGCVTNLYAKLGNAEKNICFAGHVDVVPPLEGWSSNPFILTEKDKKFYARGTNDMKGPLSSCFMAIYDFIMNKKCSKFSISVLLTSDEEIMGDNGTKKAVGVLKSKNEKITSCVLCESCSPKNAGEYIKIGCRGSLNVDFLSTGKQCHVASTSNISNNIHDFIAFLNNLVKIKIDDGNENFSPSNIEVTSIDVNNIVRNIVPGRIEAKANIRFNDNWTFDTLESFIMSKLPSNITPLFERFGYPFIGASSNFIEFLSDSIQKSIGVTPKVGTAGGNSDALFIKGLCEVVEIGSQIDGAHVVNEFITKEDLMKLKKIYYDILVDFDKYQP